MALWLPYKLPKSFSADATEARELLFIIFCLVGRFSSFVKVTESLLSGAVEQSETNVRQRTPPVDGGPPEGRLDGVYGCV